MMDSTKMRQQEHDPDFNACLMSYPFFPHEESKYGIGNYAYELLRHLHELGVIPRVLTVGDLPEHRWLWAFKETRFLHKLASVQADVYHGVDAFSAKSAALLGKRPLITTIHDVVASFFRTHIGRLSYVYNELSMKFVRKSNIIIVPFETTKQRIVAYYRLSPANVEVIHYGVDHELFRPLRIAKPVNRQVLYIGELSRFKGLETLLKGFRLLTSKFGDVELIIGGEGKHRVFFEKLVQMWGLGVRVKFVGFIPYRKLPTYYNRATVFVWPSLLGFGLTALQAAACGVPVVAAKTLDMPEFLVDTGLLFQPGDHERLAEALALILGDDRLQRDLSRRGLQKAEAFSWRETARKTVSVYQTLVRR